MKDIQYKIRYDKNRSKYCKDNAAEFDEIVSNIIRIKTKKHCVECGRFTYVCPYCADFNNFEDRLLFNLYYTCNDKNTQLKDEDYLVLLVQYPKLYKLLKGSK